MSDVARFAIRPHREPKKPFVRGRNMQPSDEHHVKKKSSEWIGPHSLERVARGDWYLQVRLMGSIVQDGLMRNRNLIGVFIRQPRVEVASVMRKVRRAYF